MSTFFKKVVSAFVVFPEEEGKGSGASTYVPSFSSGSSGGSSTMSEDALARDAAELLKQLEAGTARLEAPPMPSMAAMTAQTTAAPPETGASTAASAAPSELPASVMEMGPDQVFATAGVTDSPNSAYRVLKMISALAVFPPAQQVAMIRAMDSADESWSEEGVLEDALRRRAALRDHLDKVATERDTQRKEIEQRVAAARGKGDEVIAEIDKQIAELEALREAAMRETSEAVAKLEGDQHQLEGRVDSILQSLGQVDDELARLIHLFEHGGLAHGR